MFEQNTQNYFMDDFQSVNSLNFEEAVFSSVKPLLINDFDEIEENHPSHIANFEEDHNDDSNINFDLDLTDGFWFICKLYDCTCFSELEGAKQEPRVSNTSCINFVADANIPQKEAKLIIPKPQFNFDLSKDKAQQVESPEKAVKSLALMNNIESTMKDSVDDEQSENSLVPSQTKSRKLKSKSKNDSNLFLVRRAWFRGFSEYYKNKFAAANYSWQRKRGNKKKKTPMMTLIRQFAEDEFGLVVTKLSEEQWVKFRTTLFTIMFSHRYKKNDDFLTGIDFTEIRNVLYHYTTEARNEFLKNSQFCFLIHHFFVKERVNFLDSKLKEKSKLKQHELKLELSILDEEAIMTLRKHSPF